MIAWSTPVVGTAVDWALDAILRPALKSLIATGAARRPARYASDEEYIAIMLAVVRAQIELLPTGACSGDVKDSPDIQTLGGLIAQTRVPPTNDGDEPGTLSQRQLDQLFDSIDDWDRLIDAVRFLDSGHGVPTPRDSAVVIGTFPLVLGGSNLFAVNSPAYPKLVADLLRDRGLLSEDHPHEESLALDAPLMAIEDGPLDCVLLRTAVSAEGTHFDPTVYAKRFPPAVVEEIRAALAAKLGDGYPTDTMEVVHDRIVGSLLESAGSDAHLGGERLRFEGGAVHSGGVHDNLYRFLGGNLDLIMRIERDRGDAFLSLPRAKLRKRRDLEHNTAVALGSMTLQGVGCVFGVGKRKFSGEQITWAFRHEFEGVRIPRELDGLVTRANRFVIEAGGADPDSVDYGFMQTRIAFDGRWVPVGLVVRSEGGEPMSGWAVLRDDVDGEGTQIELIRRAEAHERRMAPDGPVYNMVNYAQRAGVQLLKARVPNRRGPREALIAVAHLLRQRAAYGI